MENFNLINDSYINKSVNLTASVNLNPLVLTLEWKYDKENSKDKINRTFEFNRYIYKKEINIEIKRYLTKRNKNLESDNWLFLLDYL